jgi:hypothetical protein
MYSICWKHMLMETQTTGERVLAGKYFLTARILIHHGGDVLATHRL